ncbi:MAG: hypothetical protein OEV49_00985 [candidate division Zixibacteria bacterium]|nr:hypothetical protein [candidate division Zixibacteria bacterium]MDH3937165.1 hypothetical protein [candidate division Zixibacteria bacterium]
MFTRIFFATMMALLLMVSVAMAGEEATPVEKAKEVTLKNQTHCPVMGGKIDSTVYTDIQGQRVYHCCAGCGSPLKKDPDKYFKKAAAEGVLFENIQTKCPVSGEELKKGKAYTDYEGRRVYLCCEGCIPMFEKDPKKFLAALDKPAEKSEAEEGKHDHDHDKDHDHSGHGHGGGH